MATKLQDVRDLLPKVQSELFGKPNVVATGIGYKVVEGKPNKELSIICSVETKKAKKFLSKKELLPTIIQNVSVDVVPTGLIHAQSDPRLKYRPAPGGVSVGHYQITAGTLGCWVKKDNKYYMLSNNHVLANSNEASIGDPILQPGPTDGGTDPSDRIAVLKEFIPILFDGESEVPCPIAEGISKFLNSLAKMFGSTTRLQPVKIEQESASNVVDAALAEPMDQKNVKNKILDIGTITGMAEGTLGMEIKKMGRTTEITTGTITQIDASVRVNYGAGKVALFVDQLVAGPLSQGGDSGSAVLSSKDEFIGLLFAGSTNTTILNRIQNVFSKLEVSL